MDYRVLALGAMIALGAYNFLIRKFFADREDWRLLIPVVVVAALALGVYYAANYKTIKATQNSWMYAVAFIAIGGLAFILPYAALAQPDAKINVAIPIFALSTVVAVALGAVFLGEQLTLLRAVGILLALASIVLLVME
ncbi:MAG: EamA family transporter [Candidatus Micrarchaeia archaeon]